VTWETLLSGDLADQARQVVNEIRSELSASFPPLDLSALEPAPTQLRMTSFEAGRGAAALLEHYCRLSDTGSGGTWKRTAIDECVAVTSWLLEQERSVPGNVLDRPPLGVGPIGVAWLLAHLNLDGGTDHAEILGWADRRVRKLVSAMPWPSDYDLVVGLVGLGTYAFERLPDAYAVQTLELIVERLADLAEHYPDGLAWRTWPGMIIGHADSCPIGRYDLGMAHGVAGVIAFLGHLAARRIAPDGTEMLLRGAVSWILARKGTGEPPFQFPAWTQPDAASPPGRLAWCYGDLGIAVALLSAARGLGETVWEKEALDLARHASQIDPWRSLVVDAPLCHGAIGVGHCFSRLSQATGDSQLRVAAAEWLARGLSMRRPGQGGIAGFSAVDVGRDGRRRRVTYRGLLQGAAGIGLSLQTALSDAEPAWDRSMLIGPPR
jgi:hypothetical protein